MESVPTSGPTSGPRRVHWAFTDARGDAADAGTARPRAAGEAHYGNFNLGGHVGDDAEVVLRHRARLAQEMGPFTREIVWMNQVHGADVAVVDGPWPGGRAPDVDGMVTARPGVGLGVLVADCVPVVLADPAAGVVGVAHAGRKGMMNGVVGATVERMRALGAQDVRAVVGPSICGACYEVPAEMRAEAAQVRGASAATTSWGTPAVDVAAGVEEELAACGVPSERVAGCTLESDHLYSYRRWQRTGRFAGVVVLEAGDE